MAHTRTPLDQFRKRLAGEPIHSVEDESEHSNLTDWACARFHPGG